MTYADAATTVYIEGHAFYLLGGGPRRSVPMTSSGARAGVALPAAPAHNVPAGTSPRAVPAGRT